MNENDQMQLNWIIRIEYWFIEADERKKSELMCFTDMHGRSEDCVKYFDKLAYLWLSIAHMWGIFETLVSHTKWMHVLKFNVS
jgi:hypothetical protein